MLAPVFGSRPVIGSQNWNKAEDRFGCEKLLEGPWRQVNSSIGKIKVRRRWWKRSQLYQNKVDEVNFVKTRWTKRSQLCQNNAVEEKPTLSKQGGRKTTLSRQGSRKEANVVKMSRQKRSQRCQNKPAKEETFPGSRRKEIGNFPRSR